MKSNIPKIRLGFLIVFVVACAGVFAYHYFYVWPAQRCEAVGDWWDGKDRTCAIPIPISHFTGRHVGGKLVVVPINAQTMAAPASPAPAGDKH
ncbi:MAG: hypothetical protein P4L64_19020 [Caulobacteraceae bacterium]|nr:hypothetical protein [Caulobacteraceae bacterium]